MACCQNYFCSSLSVLSPIPYVPVITFAGIINTDSVYLPGNASYPNSCRIVNGCVRLYLYSEDYSQGTISQGDQMRIDIFNSDTQFITEKNALFVMTRYDRGTATPTYNISAEDTLNDVNNLHMEVVAFDRRSGGEVRLSNITVSATPTRPVRGGGAKHYPRDHERQDSVSRKDFIFKPRGW